MTPSPLAEKLVCDLELDANSRVLEPSFGTGSFLMPLVRRFLDIHSGTLAERLQKTLTENIYGAELDAHLFEVTVKELEKEFGPVPEQMNLVCADFFQTDYPEGFFDFIVGNPPFGGTFDPLIEDSLDRRYGKWNGHKLKKETYSFFIARSLDLLKTDASLVFIASDTFLTIKTMSGLRRKLMDYGSTEVVTLTSFSEETSQPTLVLKACRSGSSNSVLIDGVAVSRSVMEMTGNFSWRMDGTYVKYFDGPSLADFLVATSGMTVGRNELFVRAINDGCIEEPYTFEFFDDPITLTREIERARLNKMSPSSQERVRQQELAGETRRNVRISERADGPIRLKLPHPDYRPYNKAQASIVYGQPRHVIYWRDEGDAVLTFKKNGNWYLGGVGGKKFFGREGITWPLVAPRLNVRYLPSGQILDSGSPAGFLRPGVPHSELWFILGWCLTDLASSILKTVINHTRNIQGKDVERLPYPHWVEGESKERATRLVEKMVNEGMNGRIFRRGDDEIKELEGLYT